MNPRSIHRRLVIAAALSALLLGGTAVHAADEFPSRPIKIIVGYAPGGTTDILARLIGQRLSATLGQPVIVENKPGAGGNLGAESVARSPADGYTLQMGTAGNMTINPSIYRDMKVDTVKDFAAVSMVAAVPNVMVVHPSVRARTVQEYIAYAKSRPGKAFYASSGIGNSPHMTAELFNLAAGTKLQHVPYKGSGQALTDLIGGQGVEVMFDNLPSSMAHIKAGTLRALAVTGASRVPGLPDVPTMKELGLPDVQVEAWFGLFAPAKTPEAVINRLHREVVAALQTPELRKRLDELGAVGVGNTPDEFGRVVVADVKRWADVVKAANITAQ